LVNHQQISTLYIAELKKQISLKKHLSKQDFPALSNTLIAILYLWALAKNIYLAKIHTPV